MYITVNGSTYQNAVRVRTAQSVSYTADGLEGIGAVSGVITRYRDDGFEVGSENAADYLRQEAIAGGFRLTNVPETQPVQEPPELTNKEKREQAYETRACVEYDGQTLTVDAANKLYLAYSAEGQTARAQELSTLIAVAKAGIVRTRNLVDWERLPDLKAASQQRNVVLHPEFVNGKYALYTRPQDDFINAGNGGGIGWALIDDITRAEVKDEMIINHRYYHTIKEVKNGEGPHPIRTSQGWLHLAHGVRGCAAGLRYVLYLYMTAADEPWRVIAEPAGYLLAPLAGERVGDVSNVLFSNGWIADDDGTVYIYYASSDTRMHVAVSTVDRLVDYCLHTPADGLRSAASVAAVNALIDRNEAFLNG